MTIYNDLRLKALVRKVARDPVSYDDKVLAYIGLFMNEPASTHKTIKEYIREFYPRIWEEFNYEDTKESMYSIIESMQEKSARQHKHLRQFISKNKKRRKINVRKER